LTTKSDPLNLSQRYKGNGQILTDLLNQSKNEDQLLKSKRKDYDSPRTA